MADERTLQRMEQKVKHKQRANRERLFYTDAISRRWLDLQSRFR